MLELQAKLDRVNEERISKLILEKSVEWQGMNNEEQNKYLLKGILRRDFRAKAICWEIKR